MSSTVNEGGQAPAAADGVSKGGASPLLGELLAARKRFELPGRQEDDRDDGAVEFPRRDAVANGPAAEPKAESEPASEPASGSEPDPQPEQATAATEDMPAGADAQTILIPAIKSGDIAAILTGTPVPPIVEKPQADPEVRTAPAAPAPKPQAPVDAPSADKPPIAEPPPSVERPAAPPSTGHPPTEGKKPPRPTVGKNSWREAVPYEETGVLIRPAEWSTDRIETALINVGTLRAEERERLEAEQRPRRTGWRRLIPQPHRAMLMGILFVQAALSLRNSNTAFEDEALYLYSGHLELAHLIYGAPVDDFASYFSGAPVLYPIAGAIMDQIGGLFAARLLSLVCMLSATCLIYLMGRRLFGLRSALIGAGLFGTTASAIFMGGFATYDAPCVFLLALAAWIVVRSASSSWPYYVLAVLPMMLAVGTKYASLLFLPAVIVLAGLAALPYHGWRWALLRPVALTVMVASMAYGALKLAGPKYAHGIQQTTTARATGGTSTHTLLIEISKWGAPVFAAALVGAFFYVFRYQQSDGESGPLFGRRGRAAMVALMLGTALLAPANQLRIHTDVALQKHIGFGLLFAAPLAGYGVYRLVGRHFGRIQLGIGMLVLAFAFGMSQSHIMFGGWPNSDKLINTLRQYQKPNAHYLVEIDEVPIYYLRGDTSAEPGQFTSTFAFLYLDWQGQWLTGDNAYTTAVIQGYFQVIAFDGVTTPEIDQAILKGLHSPISPYRYAAGFPEQTAYGTVVYQVWVKK